MCKLKVIILGLLAVFAISTVGTSSASALHWYSLLCAHSPGKVGTSPRRNDNFECEGTLGFPAHLYDINPVILAEGESKKFTSHGGLQVLSATVGGVNIKTLCAKLDDEGTIENPTGGGAGTSVLTQLFLGCTVDPTTLKCEIPEGMFTVSSAKGALEGTESTPVVKFSPNTGTTFAELTVTNCTNAGLNKVYTVQGTLLYKISTEPTTFTAKEVKGPESMLKFGGSEAGLEGENLVLAEGGGGISGK
jgi:hypothetical protein